jgi:hypothetical protein
MGLGRLPQLDRYLSQRQDRGQFQVAGVKELGFSWEGSCKTLAQHTTKTTTITMFYALLVRAFFAYHFSNNS